MEKRVLIRIIFEKLTLVQAAELEEKLQEVLDEYGPHSIEVTALTPPIPPMRPS